VKDTGASADAANSSDDADPDAEASPEPGADPDACGPPVTSAMMQRIAEVDEDSTLRAWVHFQKMAKEVEELIRAKENLSGMMTQMRNNEGQAWDASLRLKGDATQSRSASLRNAVEPQVVEELVQNTHDALALAHTIIDSRACVSLPPAGAKEEDTVGSMEDSLDGISGAWLQRHQRLSSSSPHLATKAGPGPLGRNGSNRRLDSVNEQDIDSPRNNRFPLSGLHNTPAAVAASAVSSGAGSLSASEAAAVGASVESAAVAASAVSSGADSLSASEAAAVGASVESAAVAASATAS